MDVRRSLAFVLVAIAAAGCADDAAPVELRAAAQTEPLVVEGPRRSIEAVTWPRTNVDAAAGATLSPASREAARRSPVPVLVPKDKPLLEALSVMSEAHWYAAHVRAGGVTVNVSATRVAHHVQGVAPAVGPEALRGQQGFVTQNEGIWSATWIENGASYVASVECDRHDDSRCASDAFLRSLVEGLAYVGGSGAEVDR